ncbi:MAG: serine hydrolase [Xanthomonadales bacterium]|nr:serine hydrolase [Xanthomonadales bacterium]
MRHQFLKVAAGCMLLVALKATAATQAELDAVVGQRIGGDRTGACLAVAVVEKNAVTRTFRCADETDKGRVGADTAFEIGSVSKTMMAALLAEMIEAGKASLDDRLADWLPKDTKVPEYQGQPILLRHVVTHTSGLPALPPGVPMTDAGDPYAKMTPQDVLAALGRVTLECAPGSQFEYSNFASMVLSYALARRADLDFEKLLRRRLFEPLGMKTAYVNQRPQGVRVATGHAQTGEAVPAWRFATDLAGVGGVHATLDDMVRYVQGQLGLVEAPIGKALALTHEQINAQPPVAMNWMLGHVGSRPVLVHEGGTGGFSSFVGFDPERQRGAVILSDTALTSVGGLGDLGLHLIDASMPLGKPRHRVAAPEALLKSLAGEYRLSGVGAMHLRVRDGKLYGQAAGQAEFELAYDDAGDFYPLVTDALLHPVKSASGGYGFTWSQGGATLTATRVDAAAEAAPKPSQAELEAYAGDYPLRPNFVLLVRARGGQLHAQASGQGEFALDPAGRDRFEAPAFGIEIEFSRGKDGKVTALDLHQGGQVLHGERRSASQP